MKSHLETLPIVLVEHIVTYLGLSDIASLRLTSRIMENKASQWSFTACFKHKDVELTTRTLQDMVRLTSQGRLGCLLQHCTLTGIVRNEASADDDGNPEHLRSLLVEAFRNLKRRSPKGVLASLRLRVAARVERADGELSEPKDFRDWRAVWGSALRTFDVTMAALSDSQLFVDEHLNVFGNLKGCSLACGAFLAFAQKSASKHVFGSLKKLTVSLSAPPKATMEQQSEAAVTEPEAQAQSSHSNLILHDIMMVLHSMPKVESLDLHWYNLGDTTSTPPVSSAAHQGNSTSRAPSHLKECSLRGIYVSENDLLQFLKAVHPTIVTLTDIHLISGTYAVILKYLTDPDSPVTCYYLDDIREGNTKLVHFEVPGSSKFRYRGGDVGPSSLTRQASHVNEPIHYRLQPGRPLGAGERMRWLKSKAHGFGPPDGHYDFIELNSEKLPARHVDSDEERLPT
ncbi:hypothetical protein MMC17_009595 [Xylographa soralifera]|nr:hypothetical protein [Xylographa soralifera]